MREYTNKELGELTGATFMMLSLGVKLDFSTLRINGETVELIAMLLRCTSTWKDNIPGYDESLKLCSMILDECGVDKYDMLFGMIENNE